MFQHALQVQVQVLHFFLCVYSFGNAALVADDNEHVSAFLEFPESFGHPFVKAEIFEQPGIISALAVQHAVAVKKNGFGRSCHERTFRNCSTKVLLTEDAQAVDGSKAGFITRVKQMPYSAPQKCASWLM